MTESENSACTWSLGVRIDNPEDIKAFEQYIENHVLTPQMKEMTDYLKTRPDLL